MRIALIYPTVSRQGGTERYAWDLARHLLKLGDEVHVITERLEVELPGAVIHRVPHWPGRYGRLLGFDLSARRRLVRLNAQHPFDLSLGLGRTLEQDVLRLGGGCHAAYLEALHGWQGGKPPSHFTFQPYHRLMLERERRSLCSEHTRLIVAVSERVREEVLARYNVPAERVRVVYNGVDLARFDPTQFPGARAALRAELGIQPQARVFLFVGSGLERKGARAVVDAFARLAAEARAHAMNVPLDLVLVGRDVLRLEDQVRRLRAELARLDARVWLLPAQAVIEPYYLMADALVLPTRYEPFGNVCLEAAAMGCPVITSECNGVSELLSGETRALILPDPLDVLGLSERMALLLDDARVARLSEAGKTLARAHSLDAHVSTLRALLLSEVRPAQVRPAQVRPAQVRPAQVRPAPKICEPG